MLQYKDVKNAPTILTGVKVTREDTDALGVELPSWGPLHAILTSAPDRYELARKALLMELAGKRRDYLCERLLSHILEMKGDQDRRQAFKDLRVCLG